MRDPERIERIIAKLREAWLVAPDVRLLQLIVGLPIAGKTERHLNEAFMREDDVTEAALDKFIALHGPAKEQPK